MTHLTFPHAEVIPPDECLSATNLYANPPDLRAIPTNVDATALNAWSTSPSRSLSGTDVDHAGSMLQSLRAVHAFLEQNAEPPATFVKTGARQQLANAIKEEARPKIVRGLQTSHPTHIGQAWRRTLVG